MMKFFDKLGFPLGGSCPRSGLMRGGLANATRSRAITEALPLIRPCGATFPLGGRQSGAAGPGMPGPYSAINNREG